MNDFEEKASLCALSRIFGFEPRIGLALISHFDKASDIFKLGENTINKILGPYSKYRGKINYKALDFVEKELTKLSEQGIDFIGWKDPNYPLLLKECEDAPIGIYIRSDTPADKLWINKKIIAIVGTRDISTYGKEWCTRLTSALSECKEKPLIISGLAYGTDICAHKTAVESGLATIAVMATGPESIYPARHHDFALKLTKMPKCGLITDYPPQTPPLPIHFLRRNRIIAGMSHATILIESKSKGGGMNTARLAFSYNRDVFALPGRIDDTKSQGCNILIKEKVAEPIISIASLIESLQLNRSNTNTTECSHSDWEIIKNTYNNSLSDNDISTMCAILIEIRKNRGINIEEICNTIGVSYSSVSKLTSILEMEGFIDIDILQRCSINIKKV